VVTIYTNARRPGLGLPVQAVPVAYAVAKNTFGWLTSLFGGHLVHGLKKEEFDARHNDPTLFRALWYDGYWVREGAGEIPAGMSIQDYYVRRFGVHPFFAAAQSSVDRLARGGVSLETLRLTSIPEGMPWPADIDTIPRAVVERVLPRPVAAGSSVVPSAVSAGTSVTAGLGSTIPLLLLVGTGLFLVWRKR